MPRWLQIIGYVTWFFLVFAICLLWTFPLDQLKPEAVKVGLEAMRGRGGANVGRHGTEPELRIGKASLWWPPGISLEDVHVQLASRNADPGPVFDIDSLQTRVGILSLLGDELEVTIEGELYSGDVSGVIVLNKEDALGGKVTANSIIDIDLEINGVKIDRLQPLLVATGGCPVTGTLDGVIDVHLGEEPNKEGEGEINLTASRLTLGPGDLKVFGPMTTEIPMIDIGEANVLIPIEKGKGKTKTAKIAGRDVNAELDAEITLSKRLTISRVKGDGSFQVDEQFLKDNSKFKMAMDFLQPLKAARDKEGRYHFTMNGNLSGIGRSVKLSKDGGKSRGKSSRSRRRR